MKTRILRILTATLVVGILLLPLFTSAAEQVEKNDLQPKITVRVDGLSCPFCAYGLEKRIKKLSAVQKWHIDIKKGTMELFPKVGQYIDLDEVKQAVKNAGFTPKGFRVALTGKLIEWEGKPAFLIVSTSENKQKIKIKYLLKENELLGELKASIESLDEQVFIAGEAVKKKSDKQKARPYTIIAEKFHILSGER